MRVTPTGIETTDGVREFDIIVWATGFDFGTGALSRMGIQGRDGLALSDVLGGRAAYLPRRADARLPEPVLPRRPARRRRQQPALQRRPGRLRHRRCSCTPATTASSVIEVTARAEERWTNMVNRGAASPLSFGEKSYYFGTNIPGKPKRYLLNSAGRPKLFSVIADVVANDYDSFTFSRAPAPAGAAG